jgi:DNA-directed RNA polymerase subunit M/transcription elongation factor TFIIS
MVIATIIHTTGALNEVSIPTKTTDVLEWLRTKTKQPGLQYQFKIQDKDRWVSVFAESGDDDDDNVNQHVLGGASQEDVFVGSMAMMLSTNSNEDNYDKLPSAYLNLKPADYETMYSNWTFEGESTEEEEEAVEDEVEDEDEPVFEEVEEEVPVPPVAPKRASKSRQVVVQDVNTQCPMRDLVKERYVEIGVPLDIIDRLENSILQRTIRECKTMNVEVTWNNIAFWNHYRGRAIQFYENMKRGEWIAKLVSNEITPEAFAELSVVDLNPKRWKAQIEKQIEKDKHLYTNAGSASIYFYCSGCKVKTRCDYYQMQTRSADEPMTTFVTCLECDRRWKF